MNGTIWTAPKKGSMWSELVAAVAAADDLTCAVTKREALKRISGKKSEEHSNLLLNGKPLMGYDFARIHSAE